MTMSFFFCFLFFLLKQAPAPQQSSNISAFLFVWYACSSFMFLVLALVPFHSPCKGHGRAEHKRLTGLDPEMERPGAGDLSMLERQTATGIG